ncbi:MAG: methionyl-tRNA formyltransferase [Planctomycetaceae bacterium]|nr:methionyl-tRNA formyltransferase [Planctomycetaceae bacterium]MBT6155304.1 methionyl-tRNA formyltransferase [Planctomycetaceae bacterium]MBT6485200.1 methionyl-tRNA formyltransferase [Planctomycetaceae bacterium]MBT6497115.1 methionyl-tRNA formyltransferase [Planctomycetaceae bacterium]
MSLRLVMMGTGEFALPTFRGLYESQHEVVALYTQPDRTGRGHHHHVNPMKLTAEEHGTPVFQPQSVNTETALADLRKLEADLYVVAAYGQILSAELLEIPRFGAVNLHASLLPRHRGAAPVQYSILTGDAETGVTIFQIDPRLDAGPVLGVVSTPIGSEETAGELESRLAELTVPLARSVIDQIDSGTVEKSLQDASQVTRAPRFKKNFGAMDWTRSAVEIERHIRAMQPWPKAFTFLCRPEHPAIRLIVISARPCESPDVETPGQITVAEGERLIVNTGQGGLELLTLRPEGKGDMAAAEFLHGHPVDAESQLTSAPAGD